VFAPLRAFTFNMNAVLPPSQFTASVGLLGLQREEASPQLSDHCGLFVDLAVFPSGDQEREGGGGGRGEHLRSLVVALRKRLQAPKPKPSKPPQKPP
jgi:hypothetical protein